MSDRRVVKSDRAGTYIFDMAEDSVKVGSLDTGKPLRITLNAPLNLDWDEWDDLVELINDRREQLPIAAIAAQLAADVAVEDELQAYITEKGLA